MDDMNRSRPTILFAALATLACSVGFALVPEPTPEQLEHNRRKLEEWEKHPERLAQLKRSAQAFQALPKDRQEQLLKVAADLFQEPAAVQGRLLDVMERYDEWLEALDAKDKPKVTEAASREARLAAIKEIRTREWMERQPKVIRDQYFALDAEGREEMAAKLRKEERKAKREWIVAARFWTELQKGNTLPSRLTDFPTEVQAYVNEYLRLFLSKEDWDRLMAVQGEWPRFPILLVKLADKTPAALPALEGPGPTRFDELPFQVQKLFKVKLTKRLPEHEWPKFGETLTHMAKLHGIVFPHEFLPYNYKGLSREMQEFYDKKLWPVLTADEKKMMTDAPPANWPDYPKAIQKLAEAHRLPPPWYVLPGSREKWDLYRFP
jgi:hypothetical protein